MYKTENGNQITIFILKRVPLWFQISISSPWRTFIWLWYWGHILCNNFNRGILSMINWLVEELLWVWCGIWSISWSVVTDSFSTFLTVFCFDIYRVRSVLIASLGLRVTTSVIKRLLFCLYCRITALAGVWWTILVNRCNIS